MFSFGKIIKTRGRNVTATTATRNDVHSKAINFEDVLSGLPRCHEGRFTFSRALNFGEHVLGYLSPFGFLRLCLFLCRRNENIGPDWGQIASLLICFCSDSACFDGFCL